MKISTCHWIAWTEGAKFGLGVLAELSNRCSMLPSKFRD
jgi:hypothetical protein